MPRVLLLVPTASYRAPDFVRAARTLGIDLIVGSEEEPVIGDRTVAVPLDDPDTAAGLIERIDEGRGVDAVVAVDDQGVVVAAAAGARLGFPHNPPDAVAATRDKRAMRERLAAGEVPQPAFADTPASVGYPCVVKPTGLSGSRGVIRCDDEVEFAAAVDRIRGFWSGPLIVERYVPGGEVAVEGILSDGGLTVLAVFDKPDPLVGPFFTETIYVTPSRLPVATLAELERLVARGAAAIGLTEGPIHAEVRVDTATAPAGLALLEIAARTIGGLCARTLRFGAGIALEEVVLRHALGMDLGDVTRAPGAAGVMMLPVPRAGVLARVDGRDEALAVDGVVGLEITVPLGGAVAPLPESDRYLGFLFARAGTPEAVEAALRNGAAALDIVVT
ncbi:MAG: ATP-grasp domain-containing protein [Acidimicrobiia bacterium]